MSRSVASAIRSTMGTGRRYDVFSDAVRDGEASRQQLPSSPSGIAIAGGDMGNARRAGRAVGTFLIVGIVIGAVTATAASAKGKKASGACSVASADKVGSIFGAKVKVGPREADRATDGPGGIEVSCTWSGSGKAEAVKLDLFGAGKDGAKQWDPKAMYDLLRPQESGVPLEDETIAKADAAVFRPEAGGDRLVVLFGNNIFLSESALGKKAGAAEKQLIAFFKAVRANVKATLFTSSKTAPNLFSGADLTFSGAAEGHL